MLCWKDRICREPVFRSEAFKCTQFWVSEAKLGKTNKGTKKRDENLLLRTISVGDSQQKIKTLRKVSFQEKNIHW